MPHLSMRVTKQGMQEFFVIYHTRSQTWNLCCCLFPSDFAFALASWQEDGVGLHALPYEKMQGINSKFVTECGIPESVEKFTFGKVSAPGLQQAQPVSKQPMCKHMGDADSCEDGDAGVVKSALFN